MKISAEDQHQIDHEACRILGLYRRRLRSHTMLETDELDLADILEWVEEYVIAPDAEVTETDVKGN